MKHLAPLILLAQLLLWAEPARADDAFVEANILGIFYHELGHAVIDIEEVPIFAQEEDAADVFSIFMIDTLFDEDTATSLAYDAALGFWLEAQERGPQIPWWSLHGPDEQRAYNTACIFYGADPEAREDFAEEVDLPQERRDWCPDEYDQANAAWGPVIDDMVARGAGGSMTLETSDDSLTTQIIRTEIEALNAEMSFAMPLTIRVEPCGEANAFYDPADVAITMCSEFEGYLRDLAEDL